MSEPTKVYVWNMRLREGNIGHASMQIGGDDQEGSYASLFPGGEGVGVKDYFKRTDIVSAPQPSLQQDVVNEGNHHPDYTGLLYGLDHERMEAMWDLLTRNPGEWKDQIAGFIKKWNSIYNLKTFNCSSTVAFLLMEGGADKIVAPHKIWFHWAPKDIAKWARKLEAKIGSAQQRGKAYAKKMGQKLF